MFLRDRRRHSTVAWWVLWIVFGRVPVLFLSPARKEPAGADKDELEAITEYGINLGLLFQITDDLLDVTATAEELGKTPGKDARSRKATFPSVYGLEVTRKTVAAVHRATSDALKQLHRPTQLLQSIADFILERQA